MHPFKEQDIIDAENTFGDIDTNDLVIRDLGYVKINGLKQKEEKKAFYLNRLSFSTHIFEKENGEYQQIDLGKTYKKMCWDKQNRIVKEVYIGSKEKFKTKIIIELLPEKEYQKRILKAKRNESRKDFAHSNAYKAQLGLNIFITNSDIPVNVFFYIFTLPAL